MMLRVPIFREVKHRYTHHHPTHQQQGQYQREGYFSALYDYKVLGGGGGTCNSSCDMPSSWPTRCTGLMSSILAAASPEVSVDRNATHSTHVTQIYTPSPPQTPSALTNVSQVQNAGHRLAHAHLVLLRHAQYLPDHHIHTHINTSLPIDRGRSPIPHIHQSAHLHGCPHFVVLLEVANPCPTATHQPSPHSPPPHKSTHLQWS